MLKSLYNLVSKISGEVSELSAYDGETVDASQGRMTAREVLEKVLPVAEEKNWIGRDETVVLYNEEPFLFHYTKENRLVWIVRFSFKTPQMEAVDDYFTSNSFAVIKVADETGEIIEARGIREKSE